MIKIDVSKLKLQPGSSETYELTKSFEPLRWAGESINFASPLEIYATATNTGNSFLVEGKVKSELLLRCSRCINEFSYKINGEFKAEFFPSPNAADSPEADVHYYTGNLIELQDVVLESILLELPMKAVCAEDCKGLCPKCGTNLNEKQCDCSLEEIDPRLEILQKLLESTSGKEV